MSIKTIKSVIKYYREDIYPLDKSYLSDSDWDVFNDICYRAYKIISKHTPEIIKDHARMARENLISVDMLSKSTKNGFIDEIPDAHIRGIQNMSLSHLIKHGHEFFECDKFEVKHWGLYFALIALYEIDTCMLLQKPIDSGRITYPNYNKREVFQSYATPALEAVVYAENAETESLQIENKIKETTSEKAKHAASKRHEKYQVIYDEFFQFYDNGNYKNDTEAAREFLKSKENVKLPFAPTNAERSLLDALRKHKKTLK